MLPYNEFAAYEKMIHERFPFVTVIPDIRFEEDYGDSLCALGVPDERRIEFLDFLAYEIAPAIDALGIEIVAVTPYSQEQAERLFPEESRAMLV